MNMKNLVFLMKILTNNNNKHQITVKIKAVNSKNKRMKLMKI